MICTLLMKCYHFILTTPSVFRSGLVECFMHWTAGPQRCSHTMAISFSCSYADENRKACSDHHSLIVLIRPCSHTVCTLFLISPPAAMCRPHAAWWMDMMDAYCCLHNHIFKSKERNCVQFTGFLCCLDRIYWIFSQRRPLSSRELAETQDFTLSQKELKMGL